MVGNQAASTGVGPSAQQLGSNTGQANCDLSFPSPSHRLLLELKHSDIGPFSVSLRPWVSPLSLEITVLRVTLALGIISRSLCSFAYNLHMKECWEELCEQRDLSWKVYSVPTNCRPL